MPTDLALVIIIAGMWGVLVWAWWDLKSISQMEEDELFALHDQMFGDDHAD